MSGHSKWSTIKRQKGATDAKRGMLFSKLARTITIAAKQGGPSPDTNLRLRLAMEQARASNMPKDNIERAIERATGAGGGQLQEVLYEGYGPEGTAILVEAATDNKNRTTQEIKNIFERGGGAVGTPGSVSFQFDHVGQIVVDGRGEGLMLQLIDLGAEDVEEVEDGIEIYVKPGELFQMKEKIEGAGVPVKTAELVYNPKTPISVPGTVEGRVVKLLENLDEHDDVQKVYTNADLRTQDPGLRT